MSGTLPTILRVWVEIEAGIVETGHDDEGYSTDWETDFVGYNEWPEAVQKCADDVAKKIDEGKCSICEHSIGWYLHEYDDSYGNPQMSMPWEFTSIVCDGKDAWAVCEDCTSVLVGPLS